MLLTPKVSTSLYEKVLDAFPARDFAFGTLLEVVDICESSSVPTAAVECSTTPRLLINPEFVVRHANTSEKLLMLVLHELNHVLLGHTRLFPLATPTDNIVFDALINAMLCKALPDPEYRALFTDFYSPHRFPECLLRPPDHPEFPKWPFSIPEVLKSEDMKDAKEVYEALYLPNGVTYEDLRRVLRAHGCDSGYILLGNHSDENPSSLLSAEAALREMLGQLVRNWPAGLFPTKGRALSSVAEELHVKPRKRLSNRARLRNLLEKVGGPLSRGSLYDRIEPGSYAVISPIPVRDRRATVLEALGGRCLLYNQEVPHKTPVPCGERVHVYLDVSGSVSWILDALYGAVLDCERFVFPMVHLFSTKVESITLGELRQGVCHTTGGTDIACVAEHMGNKKVRRAVIVTDGYVGAPKGCHQQVLKGVRLGVAFTEGCSTDTYLKQYAKFWTTVSSVSNKECAS